MKQYSIKKFYLFFSSIFIFMLHIPFVFAKNKPTPLTIKPPQTKLDTLLLTAASTVPSSISVENSIAGIYDSLKLNVMGLSNQVFQMAMQGVQYLSHAGKITNNTIISIVDFSQPSYKKRFFVIDITKKKLLFNTYVAHGINSGREYANQFSNAAESNKSSLGFYKTAETYIGKNGYSMHLLGLEKGINDKADSRAIVMHGADYVTEALIQAQGYIGRSWGCPAVPEKLNKPIINKIKNGTCLFIYSPDRSYYIHSKILQQAAVMALAHTN